MNDLELLSRRLAGLLVKRPGLALGLWGPPGIGKTYTARRVLRETPCSSLSLHATTPAAELARGLPRPGRLPAWAQRSLERAIEGQHVDTSSLTDALGALLGGLAPFIVHLEDLHEANPAQLEFAQSLARTVSRLKGVGLIATSREHPPEGFEAVQLEPLSAEETRAMLKGEIGAELPAEALEWIHDRAAGNPLFALEFFRHVARQGIVWNDGQRWRWRAPERETMPFTVEAFIEYALRDALEGSEFDAALRDALGARAMLAQRLDEATWAAVAGLKPEALQLATARLEARRIVRGCEFAHPLYREVALKMLSAEARRAIARRAIEVFRDAPEMAVGFIEDASLEPEVALAWLERAARGASDTGNEVRAAHYQARAVEYASGDERGRLALEAARVLRRVDLREASRLAEHASLSAAHRTESLLLSAELLATQGQLADAERLLESIHDTEADDPSQRTRRFLLRAMAHDFAGALELWRADEALRSSGDTNVLRAAAEALIGLREIPEAQSVLTSALRHPNLSPSDRNAFEARKITVFLLSGRVEEAAGLLSELMPKLSDESEPRVKANVLHNQGIVLERSGHLSQAVISFRRAAELFLRAGDPRASARAGVAAAWELWHLAEYEDAEGVLLESREWLRRAESSASLVECEGILSLMYLDWGTPLSVDLANKHASGALDLARSLRNPYEIVASLHDLAVVRMRQGRTDEALNLAEEMTALCETHDLDSLRANALYCRALALEPRDQGEALRLLLEAEAINEKSGGAIFSHKIGIEIARLDRDLERARRHLGWFEARGMRNNADMIRRTFPELATDAPPAANLVESARVRLNVLGPMQYLFDGSSLLVGGRKRRELLASLLEARVSGQAEVPRLELLDALYPNEGEVQSGALLKNLVYQVREVCGRSAVLTTEGGYALGEIGSDAEAFLETGDTRLWRGPYLDGAKLNRPNEMVRETLHLALRARAELLIQTDPLEAARLGRLLCEADPYDLENLHLSLRALRAGRNHKSLSRAYTQACERFLEVGQVLPEGWADFLETPIGAIA